MLSRSARLRTAYGALFLALTGCAAPTSQPQQDELSGGPLLVRVSGLPSRDPLLSPLFDEPQVYRTGERAALPPQQAKCGPQSINQPTPAQTSAVRRMVEGALVPRSDDPSYPSMSDKGAAWVCAPDGSATVLISAQGTPVVDGDVSKVPSDLPDVQKQNGHTLLQERIVAAVPIVENGMVTGVRAWGGDGGEFDYDVDGYNVTMSVRDVTAVIVSAAGPGAVLVRNTTGPLRHDSTADIDPSVGIASAALLYRLTQMEQALQRHPATDVGRYLQVVR